MTLQELQKKALELQEKYDALNDQKGRPRWTTLNLAQGFEGDVGELMKIIMAKEGLRPLGDAAERLPHELSDCLWSILVLADKYQIDLEKAFLNTLEEVEKRDIGTALK